MKHFSLGSVYTLLALALGLHFAAPAATNWVLPPEVVSQTLATPGDAHIYYFFALEGEIVSIRAEAASGSALNPAFILTTVPNAAMYQMPVSPECANPDSTGFTPLIADDDSGGGTAAQFTGFLLPKCGAYAIIVHSSRFATAGAYRLIVTPGDRDSNVIGYQGNFIGNTTPDSRVRSWRDNHLIFDFDRGAGLTILPSGHTAIVTGAFTGTTDLDARLMRLSDGGQSLAFNDYKAFTTSPAANHIAFAGLFNSGTEPDLRVHSMPDGAQRVSVNTVSAHSFAPDSRTIAVRGRLNSDGFDDLALYRLADGAFLKQINTITAYSWSPSGEGLIVQGDFLSGSSVEYRVLNGRTGAEIHLNSEYASEVYSPDGRYAAVFGKFIGNDSVLDLLLYDFRTNTRINTTAIRSFTKGVFAPHGQAFITFGFSNADANLDVRVYSMPDGALVHESLDVNDFAQFSPDGEILVLRGRLGRADGVTRHRFVRLPSGAQLGDFIDVNNVYFSPAGTLTVFEGPIDDALGNDYSVRATAAMNELRFYSRVGELKFDPSDDFYMVRGEFDLDTVIQWDVARTRSGESVFLAERVTRLDFSPAGNAFWIEYDPDEDSRTEKFLIGLPEGTPNYRDEDDDIDLFFEGFAPRGQGFLIRGDRDIDPKIEYSWHASPEGTQLYLIEDMTIEKFSLNGTFHAIRADFEDINDPELDIQIRRSRTGQIADTRLDPTAVNFTPDEEAAVYEDVWEDSGEFGYIIVRLLEGTVFPQTVDITSFQLSFDRFNPNLPQFEFTAAFEGGANGWASGTAAPILDPATFAAANDRLTITAANNLFSFGFWGSPLGVIPAPGSAILLITAKVQSNVLPEVQTPHFRLRYGTDDNQVAALLRVNSPPGSQLIPGVDGKTYAMVYDPPAGAEGLTGFLAIDQLNFDPADAPNGDTSLDEIIVDIIPRAILPPEESLRTFEFAAGDEGWRTFAWPGGTPPTLVWGAGALQLIPTSRVDSFGFWDGPLPTVSDLQEGQLYGARFEVGTTGATAGVIPGFRLRLQDAGTSITSELQILSRGAATVPPTAASPRQFTAYLYAMPGLGGASIFPSIDLLSFDPNDDTETILLERVEIFRMPLP